MSDTSLIFNIFARDKASATFDKMKAGAAAAGLAIGAALAAGVAQMLEKSKADAMLAAQLGATPAVADRLGKISGDVFAKGFGETVQDVNNALKTAWQNGLIDESSTDAEMAQVTQRVTVLGSMMEEESGRVAAAVTNMLRNGLAKSSEEAFDILTKGVQSGVNKSEDLLDSFNEYGPQFAKLGLDGPRAMGLLSQAVKAGARDADTAADALKEFALRSASGSKVAAKGFEALGMDATKMTKVFASGGAGAAQGLDQVLDKLRAMKDPVAREAAAVALFGTKAEDLQASLFAMDPSGAVNALGAVSGAAAAAGNTLEQSAGQKLEAFKRKAMQALVETLAQAVPYIEATFGWLSRNSSWVTPLAAGLAAFAAVIYTITAAMKVWSAVQVVLNLALWTSPITWIILGIVALIAIIVLIATKTTWFQTAWRVAWGGIKAGAAAVWNWIKANWPLLLAIITGPIGIAVYAVVSNWNKIKNGARTAFDFVKTKASSVFNWLAAAPGRVSGKLAGMFSGLWSGFRSNVNKVIGGWNRLSFGIPGFSFAGVSVPGFSVGTPDIPYLAKGGHIVRSGLAMVGERGPELVHLGGGASVHPLNGRAGGNWKVRLDVAGEREIVALFRRLIRTANLLQDKG